MACDNQSAIAMTKNPEFHSRTKHIDLRYHWIRNKVEEREIEVVYVPTEHNTADVFTKALGKEKHSYFTTRLHVLSPPQACT